MTNYTLGIDFGKQGGFAFVYKGVIIKKWPMPTTKEGLIDCKGVESIAEYLIWEYPCDKWNIYGEKLHAIYGSSAKATFSFGQAYGTVIGIIETHLGPINLVRAVDWQKAIFKKFNIDPIKKKDSKKNDTKKMALHAALKQWPDEDWRESPRHRRVHDGMLDASLIGLYGEDK